MSQKYLDALASERQHNAVLRKVMLLVAGLGAIGMFLTYSLPKHLELHVAPDMKAGDTVSFKGGQAPVPTVNVYGFAYYIWQQINRWQADGAVDYGKQIYDFQAYLTPRCQAQLQGDMEDRFKKGELRQRTRQITEVPGFSFAENRVITESTSAWTVLLDMQVMESYRGQAIKDVFIRYPVRVVRYDVDRQRNPWRLAVDCFGSNRPARLDAEEIKAVQSGKPGTALALPQTVTPAALPKTADQSIDPSSEMQPTPLEVPASPTTPAQR